MTVRILCRAPGRTDVVLTLLPNHYERVDFGQPGGEEYVYPPHVAILLLEDSSGCVDTTGRHIDEQHAPVITQGGLL